MSAVPEWKPPELRPQEELRAMATHVGEHGYSGTAGYDRGVIAALRWAAGLTETPPVSDVPLSRSVTGSDAKREQYRAYEAMGGLAEPALRAVVQEQGHNYVTGVENTLAWVVGGDVGLAVPADWPWPQDRL